MQHFDLLIFGFHLDDERSDIHIDDSDNSGIFVSTEQLRAKIQYTAAFSFRVRNCQYLPWHS